MAISLMEFTKRFPDEDACLEYIFQMKERYKNKVCPKCKRIGQYHRNRSISINRTKSIPCYTCTCGEYSIYPRQDTGFAKTRIDLQKWFTLVFITSTSSQLPGIGEISKVLGITKVAALNLQLKLLEVIMRNIKDRSDLTKWERQTRAVFRNVSRAKLPYFLGYLQYKDEIRDSKEDPFFHLLDLCINGKKN